MARSVTAQALALLTLVACLAALCSADVGHHHETHGGIHDDRVMTNADHIKSHLSQDYGINKDPSEMSKAELEFYEFKSHDFDKNSKLDGLEMLKAMTHYDFVDVNFLTPEEQRTLTPKEVTEKRERLVAEKYASMEKEIDHIIDEHDLDKDGYIDYAEYLMARWKDEK